MLFIANLRNETIDAFEDQQIQPAGYLLSSHRVTPASLESAARVIDLGLPLIADNGTKPLIDGVLSLFSERARSIRLAVRDLRRTLGHIPRGREIPKTLRSEARALADDVVAHTTSLSESIDDDELLETQLAMRPTDLIAKEDFAVGCLIGLGLERETTGWSIARFDSRNRRSLRLWRSIRDDPRCSGVRVHAVVGAMDYNTARSAGRLAADAGVMNLALGIAGINRDARATDFILMGRASLRLQNAAPRRYVRLAQILRGIRDGYGDRAKTLQRFHCLGLGAARMFPIPPAALQDATTLTTDATSPIHDAVRDKVLYDPERDGKRATTRGITVRIVTGGDWPFLSPFTQQFRATHGHRPEDARAWWVEQNEPAISDALLGSANPLTSALPLFSEAHPAVRIAAQRSRIAHNHWVLGSLGDAFPAGPERSVFALSAIEGDMRTASTVTTRGLRAAHRVLTRPSG